MICYTSIRLFLITLAKFWLHPSREVIYSGMEHQTADQKKRPNLYNRVLDAISESLGVVSGFAILLMVALVTFNVITRKLFAWSIKGFYEILEMNGAVLYAFGLVYCAVRGQHIVMTLLVNRLKGTTRKVFNWLTRIIIFAFCALFAYTGAEITMQKLNQLTFELDIPVYPFRFAVVLAFVLLALLILGGKEIGREGE